MSSTLIIWLAATAFAAESSDNKVASTTNQENICEGVTQESDPELYQSCNKDTTVKPQAELETRPPIKETSITSVPLDGSEVDPFPPLRIFDDMLVRGLPDNDRVQGWPLTEVGQVSGYLGELVDLQGEPGSGFGTSLSEAGGLLAVGAPGAARVYVFDGSPGMLGDAVAVLRGEPGAGSSVALGDFDGDGHVDAAVASWTGVAVAYGPLSGTLDLSAEFSAGAELAVGDWNADGQADIAAAHAGGTELLLGPALTPTLSLPVSPTGLAFADVDGDGADDVVAGVASWDWVEVYLGGEGADDTLDRGYWGEVGSQTGASVGVDPEGGLWIGATDRMSRIPGELSWSEVTGTGTYTVRTNGVHGVGRILAADLDGNGQIDAATASAAVTGVHFR